jgi:PhnB protein
MPDRALLEQLDQAIDALLAGHSPALGEDPELAPLVEIARALRDLPSENFQARLKSDLQRRAEMTPITSKAAGLRTITPFLIHAQAPELVEFLKHTFQAEELKRLTGSDVYGFYSEVRIGDSVIMIGGGEAARRGNLPSALHVFVDDCDAAYRRALEAGATTLMGTAGQPADRPYGERSAFVQDAFGNYWYIATRFKSTPVPEGWGSVLAHAHPADARQYIDFLKRAFGAQEIGIVEYAGRVMHASVRIGDAVLEMGEAADRTGIPMNGFFLFVDDVDAAYRQALAAGATTHRPPQDTPYGMRSAIVQDPSGYLWWPARKLE